MDDDLVKLLFRLDHDKEGWPPFEVEGIWCARRGDLYAIDNIPFFVADLALGDVIRAEIDEHGDVTGFEVVEPSGSSNLWVAFVDPEDDRATPLIEGLTELGCGVELFQGRDSGFRHYAIDVPPAIDLAAVEALIESVVDDEKAGFAEGCVRHGRRQG